MKDIKIGDLVRMINPWTAHNPWMQLPNSVTHPKIALVVKADAFPKDKGVEKYAIILTEGGHQTIKINRLEVICK